MKDKELLLNKKHQLIQLTKKFCQESLDEDYAQLCQNLVSKMARKRKVPFLSGNIEIWAAAVVYALGQINFLFDKSFEPYCTHADICVFFGTKISTTSQKARLIRDMFSLEYWDGEFSTTLMKGDNPYDKYAMVDGFIVTKEFIEEKLVTCEKENESDILKQLEENITKTFEDELKNNELPLDLEVLDFYAQYLNNRIQFPFEAKIIEETGLFGTIITKYKVNSIQPATKLKTGIICKANSSGCEVEIPLVLLNNIEGQETNDMLILEYQKWFLEHTNQLS